MKRLLLAACAVFASLPAQAEARIVRDIKLVACPPVATMDGTRVSETFAPTLADCKNEPSTVLIRIAEFGGLDVLCSYRGGGRPCITVPEMNEEQKAHFERLRVYAVASKKGYGVCRVGDGVTWMTEMITSTDDCSPEVHAIRHWDYLQKRVYLKDGFKGIGVVELGEKPSH